MKCLFIEIKYLINQLNNWKNKAKDKISALEDKLGEIIQNEALRDKENTKELIKGMGNKKR